MLLIGGCAGLRGGAQPVSAMSAAPPAAPPAASASPTPATEPTLEERAAAIVARMGTAERAGQVLMTAGTVEELPGLEALVERYGLGGVMVRGRTSAGVKGVAKAVRPLRDLAPDGMPLLVATDQEGGTVQVLRGPGFGELPSAVEQGTWPAGRLYEEARGWGAALADAGVNLDLAPVADTPCRGYERANPPVADLRRHYATEPERAGQRVAAVVEAFGEEGVQTTVKHFPGLGCVHANTDTTAHVVDRAIGADSARLAPFTDGIDAGAGFVMMSSATYTKLDPKNPAVFSKEIIEGLLRDDLGFQGVVITDDIGGAAAMKPWSRGDRAVTFLRAGGDLVLDIVPGDVPVLVDAIVAEADADAAFGERLEQAATRVVAARLALAER